MVIFGIRSAQLPLSSYDKLEIGGLRSSSRSSYDNLDLIEGETDARL